LSGNYFTKEQIWGPDKSIGASIFILEITHTLELFSAETVKEKKVQLEFPIELQKLWCC